MKGTGVFATVKESEELAHLAHVARAMPQRVAFGGGSPAAKAREDVKNRCNEMAIAHGLRRIVGRYDILETGEFLRPTGLEGEARERPEGDTEQGDKAAKA